MPEEPDRDVYRAPPSRTPKTELTNPLYLVDQIFRVVVDAPVTAWREWIERQHAKNKFYYYHRNFRRVPDYTECLEDDYICYYEAEMQWKRDKLVDRQIVRIIQERMGACKQREGPSYLENCAAELQHFKEVTKAYDDRYGELGGLGTARKCLMKQKHRMIKERKEAKAAAEAH
ncbi:Complex I-PDSW [Podarcis lilfordi]|uniref:NADH dehydrogenase [ubiquinone] 1 beta subcomplex subunit 10 n=1 Tax=Podarcis lilfordi TaxID=74358 RepID=A0AA35LAM9_9SAUR|nr:Complex I-PDSW [Podarcis lilfordi]